jgi:hypothetical protein
MWRASGASKPPRASLTPATRSPRSHSQPPEASPAPRPPGQVPPARPRSQPASRRCRPPRPARTSPHPSRIMGPFQRLDQRVARGILSFGGCRQADFVSCLFRPLVDRRAVDCVDQRPEQRVARDDEGRQEGGFRQQVRAGRCADRRRAPQSRRRVEPAYIRALLHDRARAEKANARDDIGHHLRRGGAGDAHAEIDERRRSHSHEHIRAQAGGTLSILPLRADQRAKHEGRREAESRVEKREKVEGLDEAHRIPPDRTTQTEARRSNRSPLVYRRGGAFGARSVAGVPNASSAAIASPGSARSRAAASTPAR